MPSGSIRTVGLHILSAPQPAPQIPIVSGSGGGSGGGVITGSVTAFQGGAPWSVAPTASPLPANAAQETGGNLASLVTAVAQLNDAVRLLMDAITAHSLIVGQLNGPTTDDPIAVLQSLRAERNN
jgi:hypothetical protein